MFGTPRRRYPQLSSTSLADELLVEPETPESLPPPEVALSADVSSQASQSSEGDPEDRGRDYFEKKVTRYLLCSIYIAAAFLVFGERWLRSGAMVASASRAITFPREGSEGKLCAV